MALATPQALFDELPLDEPRTETLLDGRAAAHAILTGEDDRLLVVVGPCSVHDVRGHPGLRRAAWPKRRPSARMTC